MSFKDDIRNAVDQARSRIVDADNVFAEVLEDFAEALSSDALLVDIVKSQPGGQRRSLRICPRHRPALAQRALSFAIQETEVIVLAESQMHFSNRESFENYLRGLVKNDVFVASLVALENQFNTSVDAYLRTRDPSRISRDDLLVVVSPQQQAQLGQAESGSSVHLSLPLGGVGAGIYRNDVVYQFLYSAGIILRVTRTAQGEAELIEVDGVKSSTDIATSVYADLPNDALQDIALKLASGLRGLASIYRRDKRALDSAPDDESRKKALHYAASVESLQEYIRDQYASGGVQMRECKQELERRLRASALDEPIVDYYRPQDPAVDLDLIANYLEKSARLLSTPT